MAESAARKLLVARRATWARSRRAQAAGEECVRQFKCFMVPVQCFIVLVPKRLPYKCPSVSFVTSTHSVHHGNIPEPPAIQVRDGTRWGGVLRHRADRDGSVRVRLRACVHACGCDAPVAMRSPVPAPTSLTIPPPGRQALVNVASNMCMLPAIYVAMIQSLRFEAGVQRHPLARRTHGTFSECSQMTARIQFSLW